MITGCLKKCTKLDAVGRGGDLKFRKTNRHTLARVSTLMFSILFEGGQIL